MNEEQIILLKESHHILENRDPEFKQRWRELCQYSLEEINNSPFLRVKVFLFSQKYDKILADIIKSIKK